MVYSLTFTIKTQMYVNMPYMDGMGYYIKIISAIRDGIISRKRSKETIASSPRPFGTWKIIDSKVPETIGDFVIPWKVFGDFGKIGNHQPLTINRKKFHQPVQNHCLITDFTDFLLSTSEQRSKIL